MPGHTFLYSPPVLKIKELLDAGALGDVYFMSMSRVNLGLHQPDVSVVWDLGPHDFSILRFWLGMLPTEVSALTRACVIPDTPDVAFINARFDGGAIAHLELSWLSPSKLRRTAIVGSEKMIVYDDTSGEPVRIFDSGASLPDPETFGEFQLTYRTGDIVSPKIEATEPLALEILDFCGAVLDGTTPRSSAQLGLDVVQAVEAVDRSLAAGGAPGPGRGAGRPARRGARRARLAHGLPLPAAPRPAHAGARPHLDRHGDPRRRPGRADRGPRPRAARREGRGARGRHQVGGISKTVEVDGYRFDLGGHRFFSKLAPVVEALGGHDGRRVPDTAPPLADLLQRPVLRLPAHGEGRRRPPRALGVDALRDVVPPGAGDALGRGRHLRGMGHAALRQAALRRVLPHVHAQGLGDPGLRDQGALGRAADQELLALPGDADGPRPEANDVTTLIEEFRYPRLGPVRCGRRSRRTSPRRASRSSSSTGSSRSATATASCTAWWRATATRERWLSVDGVVTSLALVDLIDCLEPAPPEHVVAAAKGLRYRDFCIVALMTSEDAPFPDNWIYLHDPETRAGRVQNYGAWSDGLVRPGTTCLGVEYFCFEGDEIWEMPEDEAIDLATNELGRIGLIDPSKVFGGAKVRVPKAYPMYDPHYEEHLAVVRGYLAGFSNLRTCGRNGLHRYNNQDHSMWTAVLATLNLLDGTEYDVWSVNTEAEYHEEGEVGRRRPAALRARVRADLDRPRVAADAVAL